MNIRENANRLLAETSLIPILESFGTVHITGSYAMDLMAWNDLDLYLLPDLSRFDMYQLISAVNSTLHPLRFDGIVQPEKQKWFYGAEFLFQGERWNLDIWIRNEDEIRRSELYCREIVRQTDENPSLRQTVIEIKEALIQRGAYGIDKHPQLHYHSADIYSAVLNENILSAEAFLNSHPL